MLTIPELVDQYGITKTTLYKWIKAGYLRHTVTRRGIHQREYLIDPDSWKEFWEARQALPEHGNGRRLPPLPTATYRSNPGRSGPCFENPPMKGDIDFVAMQAKALKGCETARADLRAAGVTRWYRVGYGDVIGGEA